MCYAGCFATLDLTVPAPTYLLIVIGSMLRACDEIALAQASLQR